MSEYRVPERCEFCNGDSFDGRYRVESLLGEGTFGTVYKVRTNTNDQYSVKLLKLWTVLPEVCRSLRNRFTMEFETGRVKSNYLVHSYSYGEVKGNPYIVMEYCPNGSLKSYSNSKGIDYVRVGKQILLGLRDLHRCGKVHRDLKPENVLFRQDYTAVLTDFGISGDQNKRMTERGFMGKPQQVFGTYPYMPPEQVNPPRGGQATVLPTTDIFSFGVMMYELLVGRLPFGELSENTLHVYLDNGKEGKWDRKLLKRADRTGIWLPIVEGCLVPNFKNRIQSVDEIIKMLPETKGMEMPIFDEPVMSARNGLLLRVMQGEEYGKTYNLSMLGANRHILTMGRKDEFVSNAIPILENNSTYISRRHCTLEKDSSNGQWIIRDGQWVMGQRSGEWRISLNGTYVNSTEVDTLGMPIRLGDIISIGDVKLRVEGY